MAGIRDGAAMCAKASNSRPAVLGAIPTSSLEMELWRLDNYFFRCISNQARIFIQLLATRVFQ